VITILDLPTQAQGGAGRSSGKISRGGLPAAFTGLNGMGMNVWVIMGLVAVAAVVFLLPRLKWISVQEA
jgi:hypothetical protein